MSWSVDQSQRQRQVTAARPQVDGVSELLEDEDEDSTSPSDICRRGSLDKQTDDDAGPLDPAAGRTLLPRSSPSPLHCPAAAAGDSYHGDEEKNDTVRPTDDDEKAKLVCEKLPPQETQTEAGESGCSSHDAMTSHQQVSAPPKPTRRLTGLRGHAIADQTQHSSATNSKCPQPVQHEPAAESDGDGEIPTRPWSADEYNDHSAGQLDDPPSQRRQSAEDANESTTEPADDVAEMSGRWSSRSGYSGSATGRRPRAFARRDTPRCVHMHKHDRGFVKHVSLTTPASLFEEGEEMHDTNAVTMATAAVPSGLRRSMTTDDAKMTSQRATQQTNPNFDDFLSDNRVTRNGDEIDKMDFNAMTLYDTESRASMSHGDSDATLSRDESLSRVVSRDHLLSRDHMSTTTKTTTTAPTTTPTTGVGAKPKTTKVLRRKNTPIILPKVHSLYSGKSNSSGSIVSGRNQSVVTAVLMEEDDMVTSLMTSEAPATASVAAAAASADEIAE